MSKLRLILSIIFFVFALNIYGQKWTYSSGDNAFDGKYKSASVIGEGGKFPYNEPILVVNNFENENIINVYLSKAGYAGCENKVAYLKFDDDQNLYSFDVSTNSDNDVWFLRKDFSNNSSLSILELIDKLKTHNKAFIRLSSSCGQSDYTFSLSGSTVALNFIMNDYLKREEQLNQKRQSEKSTKAEIIEMISQGGTYSANIKYNASVLLGESTSKPYKKVILSSGEKIIFSDYSPTKEYCVLINATTINLSQDTTFYISRFAIDLMTVQRLE